MARRSNQKLKLLYLSKIFIEKTDEQHKLTLSQILDELARYGVSAERKSVYDDIEALRVFGLDIKVSRDRYVRYYMSQGSGSVIAEAKIVYELLCTDGILGDYKIYALMKKLYPSFDSKSAMFANANNKSVNDDVYKNICSICSAISADKKLRFKCYEWNSRKQRLLLSRGEYFCVSPIALKYEDGRYVLYAVLDNSNEEKRICVDRMINASVLNKKRDIPQDLLRLPCDELENVRLVCSNNSMGALIDRFGTGITILLNRDEYFESSVKVEPDISFFAWVFSQCGNVNIVSPESVRKKYEEMLKKGSEPTFKIE